VISIIEYMNRQRERNLLPKIVVIVDNILLNAKGLVILEEGKTTKIGRIPVRKDSPHFQGDERHAHADIEGGYEISWTESGKRRHPKKFPAEVPATAKEAVAKVLGIKTDILEGYIAYDEAEREEVIILEVKQTHDVLNKD